MTSNDWRAPRQAPDLRKLLLIGLAAVIAVTAVVFGIRALLHKEPPPPPPPPTAQPLNDAEALGVKSALDDMARPHQVSGTVTDGNLVLTVNLTYSGDRVSGIGTVTAGRETADALLDQNVVFLKGRPEFWQAVGIEPLSPPDDDKWIALDPRFLGGKLFQSTSDVSTALAPTPTATLDGNIYTPSDSSPNQATMVANGFSRYSVNGVEVEVVPLGSDAATEAAAPAIADRGGQWGVMAGLPGKWALASAPGMEPKTSRGGDNKTGADKPGDDKAGAGEGEPGAEGDTDSETTPSEETSPAPAP
jgi:hypothetical protein